jgi:uroporphyrinogen decarboxylase
MAEMTSHERFLRTYERTGPDRVPMADSPWWTTLERWYKEGMPDDVDWREYFGLDLTAGIGADNSPRFERKVLEETDEYVVATTQWGATQRTWKHATSTPEWLDFTVKDRESWERVKARMTPDRDRIDWDNLQRNYRTWRDRGFWITGGLWFGFDVTHARVTGTEQMLMMLIDDPELCVDMFNHFLDVSIALQDQVWDAGYTFDEVSWPDDLGYKYSQFMSMGMYRELLKPVHKRAVDWAHAKGCKVRLHSCGDIRPLIGDWVEIGIDAINPLEVKAGVDPVEVKREWGDRLTLHGGINAVLWDHPDQIEAEMREVIPALAEGGGYIFASDHSIPDSVSLDDFRRIVELYKELGQG